MISLELLTFKDGHAIGNMFHQKFWHLWRRAGCLFRGGEEEMALGKMEEELIYNSGGIQSQP